MAQVVVTHRVHLPLSSGGTADMIPGLRPVTDEIATHPDLAKFGILSVEGMSEAELAEHRQNALYWDGRITGLTVNVPQTDVNASGAASARHHLIGDFGTEEEREARRAAFAPGFTHPETELPPPSGGGTAEPGSQPGQPAGGGPRRPRPRTAEGA